MSKARRKPVVAAARDAGTLSPVARGADPLQAIVAGLAVALLVVRWLVPTESAVDGDTLWIVQLWLVAAIAWAWSAVRRRDFTIRFDGFDAAFWTIVAGHLLSLAVLWRTAGDRRAALNVSWEWIGLGTSLFVLRQVVSTAAHARRLAVVVAVLGVVLAGLGIWQHYVFYPRAAAEYQTTQADLAKLSQDPVKNARRIRELQFNMQSQGVPADEMGRLQYENRLRFSNEPFGPFALANTFAGLLLVSVTLGAGFARAAWQTRSKAVAACWLIALLIELYCLVLTKGRTAWIGLLLAMGIWGASLLRSRTALNRRTILIAVIGLLVVASLVALAALGGGFDVQVVSEAPKSLAYRLQYWKGAIALLREHPVFGTGPGNFRHPYLEFKRADSSEEIADPHNLVLDLWANGGIVALLGLGLCAAFAASWLFRRKNHQNAPPQSEIPADNLADDQPSWRTVVISTGAGFLLSVTAPVVSGTGGFEAGALLLLAAWLATFSVLRPDRGASALSGGAVLGAAAGLMTHLLGAGGIEMPAIVQCLVLLAVLGSVQVKSVRAAAPHPRLVLAFAGIGVVLFVCCLVTATRPVLMRRALVAAGDVQMSLEGNFDRAAGEYAEAAVRDPFSPDPPEKLAGAMFAKWESRPAADADDSFRKGMNALAIAIELDPFNPNLYRRRGELYLVKFARSNDLRAAESAVDSFRKAVELYPNDSTLRAKLASALVAAGHREEAQSQAQRALELDRINHAAGHSDRYLPPATVEELRQISAR